MKNENGIRLFKVISVMLIISIIYSLATMYPNYGSSFDMGLSAGLVFGHAIKVLGTIGLVSYGIRTIRKRGIKALN
jgi:hypothetical protein